MVMNFNIILFDLLKPPTLSHVEIGLGENIFKTLMICVDVAKVTKKIVVIPDFRKKPDASHMCAKIKFTHT
jgi:hypothetical protein